jgi:hypothetical protein
MTKVSRFAGWEHIAPAFRALIPAAREAEMTKVILQRGRRIAAHIL